jgi:hypothetical protein
MMLISKFILDVLIEPVPKRDVQGPLLLQLVVCVDVLVSRPCTGHTRTPTLPQASPGTAALKFL